MSTSSTMTIRLSAELKSKLERVADNTRRSKSWLAGEAIERYVDRELEIINGIERGLADVQAGRVTPHDEVMADIRARIDAKANRA